MSLPPTELLRRFGLSAPELVAETARAIVWRVRQQTGTQAALKYYPGGHMGNEASGLAYLERVEGAGAVRVFARSTDAVVMEWLQGPSLGEMARRQDPEAADRGVTEVAARLFAAEVSADGLLSVAEIMAPLRDACFAVPEAREAQDIAWACLDQMQRGAAETVALHGDLHHDNIIHTAQGLRAFDAKGLAGPRAYELANAFRHLRGCRAFATDAQVIRHRAITWGRVAGCGAREQLRWAIAKLLLSMLWSGQEPPEERALLRQMLRVAEKGLPDQVACPTDDLGQMTQSSYLLLYYVLAEDDVAMPSTRERIVEQADVLFYERGYEATSLADIAAPLGLSRGNFYYHFKTKDEILDAVIDLRLSRTAAMLTAWEAEGDTPLARITCFIRILIRNRAKIMSWGCPVGTLVSELSKLEHIAQARAAELFTLFIDWLAVQFRSAGVARDASALATHLMGRSQGVAALAQAFGDEALIETEVAQMTDWVAQQIAAQPIDYS